MVFIVRLELRAVCGKGGHTAARRAAAGNHAPRIDPQMPRIQTQPAYGAFAIFDAALRKRMVNAFDAVLRRGRDQATSREVFRRRCELRWTSRGAATTKEEDHRRPPVGRFPIWWKVEIDFQIALRCGLVANDG